MHKFNQIRIRGAREHNLQGIDLDIPRDAITVITGVSGSGKSSLAFDTLYAEGQRQYIDSLSTYARQFLDQLPRADVDSIDGLAPTLAIDQQPSGTGTRSTVSTVTEIYDYLRLLYARAGTPFCAQCGIPIAPQSPATIRESLLALPAGTKLMVMAPMVRGRRGAHRDVLEAIQKAGLIRARVDGEQYLLDSVPDLAPRRNHTIEAIVDRLSLRDGIEPRLRDSLDLALRLGAGVVSTLTQQPGGDWSETLFSTALACPECGDSFAEIEPRTFSFNSPYGACPDCDGVGEIDHAACPRCHGARLKRQSLAVRIGDLNIAQVVALSVTQAADWLRTAADQLPPIHQRVAAPISREVIRRLEYLQQVGVGYLTLDRRADSLSGGELQRVRLATSIGSGLVGVCYVLDEPSIGLHPADHERLIGMLRQLQRQGNTIVVVEHDEATIRAADFLVDLGPGAGAAGGRIISQGSPTEVSQQSTSLTGQFLSGSRRVPIPQQRRGAGAAGWLTISEVRTHNLKGVTAEFPLGTLIGISGVSGSGKSSLINDTLHPAVARQLDLAAPPPGPYRQLRGADRLDKLIRIDQAPIGRSSRSCPATYAGVLDEVRKVFAATRFAKTRGFTAGRFSFNSPAGQCELCKGHGVERIEMNFLSDLLVNCHRCGGRRFNRQTLQVRFKGHSIADVLDFSVDQAAEFFANIPRALHVLRSLQKVGLGYLRLGQASTTLSGGEAQRIKLGTELARRATGRTLYLLDEPTTGLHFADVERLVHVLQELVDSGNTVIVIEHQFDLLATCDWIIDLGPAGGDDGGQILSAGTPEQVAQTESATGRHLKQILQSTSA